MKQITEYVLYNKTISSINEYLLSKNKNVDIYDNIVKELNKRFIDINDFLNSEIGQDVTDQMIICLKDKSLIEAVPIPPELDDPYIKINGKDVEIRSFSISFKNSISKDIIEVYNGPDHIGELNKECFDDINDIEIRIIIADIADFYCQQYIKIEDEIVDNWELELSKKMAKTYSAIKPNTNYYADNYNFSIKLTDFDSIKLRKAFDSIDSKAFWQSLVIK